MSKLPAGIVTFLFTDIEGSTRRWEQNSDAMQIALVCHDALVTEALEAHGAHIFKTVGDAFYAVFEAPGAAIVAAVAIQRAIESFAWNLVGSLRVRVALHTGEAEVRDDDYFGPALSRVARLLASGHGGQILLTQAVKEAVAPVLAPELALDDLGVHYLKDLVRPEHVYQLQADGLPDTFPPLRTLNVRPTNLPAQPTALVGREYEVAAVVQLMRRSGVRFVTLTGPGGTGKTRLSLQIAAELIDSFEDGVFFVALAAISDPALFIPTVAHTLGVREVAGQPLADTLKLYLQDKHMLVVLDNFEQIAGAAAQVSELLEAAPKVKLLVTSRTLLHLYGEHDYSVPPLRLPDLFALPPLEHLLHFEAVRLFVERAQALRLDFQLTAENAQMVAEICVRLDGLPLAIELAAARVRMLSLEGILARLNRPLNLLTNGPQNLPARQRTIRGAIDWSYQLLEAQEQRLFRALGIFVGGWTVEDAEAVCDDQTGDPAPLEIVEGLASLFDKSLIRQETVEGETRFTMLETIREYALERLEAAGELPLLRRRHTERYLACAEELEPLLTSPQQQILLDRLTRDHDNLRSALAWATEQDPELALRLGGAVWKFWQMRSYISEGRRWLVGALQAAEQRNPPLRTRARVRALWGAAWLTYMLGDGGRADVLFLESLALARALDDKAGIGLALHGVGQLAPTRQEKIALYEESLTIFREIGNTEEIAWSLSHLGCLALEDLNGALAYRYFEESLALFQQVGHRWAIGMTYMNMGGALREQQNHAAAMDMFKQSVALFREIDARVNIAGALAMLGRVALSQDDGSGAAAAFLEALLLAEECGAQYVIFDCLEGLAALAAGKEDHRRSLQLYALVEAHREVHTLPVHELDQPYHDRMIARGRQALGEADSRTVWSSGRALPIDQGIRLAREG